MADGLVVELIVEVVDAVVADVHPHVAPAVRRHRRLPRVALVVGVVARLIDVREAEVEDRPAEAMMMPMRDAIVDVTLNTAHAHAIEVNLPLDTVVGVEVDWAT